MPWDDALIGCVCLSRWSVLLGNAANASLIVPRVRQLRVASLSRHRTSSAFSRQLAALMLQRHLTASVEDRIQPPFSAADATATPHS